MRQCSAAPLALESVWSALQWLDGVQQFLQRLMRGPVVRVRLFGLVFGWLCRKTDRWARLCFGGAADCAKVSHHSGHAGRSRNARPPHSGGLKIGPAASRSSVELDTPLAALDGAATRDGGCSSPGTPMRPPTVPMARSSDASRTALRIA